MKAIRVHQPGAPEVMRLEETPNPKPGPGQVLVRIKAAGVNPVDAYIRAGTYPARAPLPYTPGIDGAGTVSAAGSQVTRFKVGDRVYVGGSASGTYAELALCEEAQVHPLPKNLSFAQGAAIHVPYATAFYGLFHRACARPGETVLVHGASGGVGVGAVQIARAYGFIVIGTAGTDEGLALVREQGAHHVFSHRSPDYMAKIMELTGGRGVDVILEMLADVNLAKDLPLLAKKGRVVVIGSRGNIEINPRDTMGRNAGILGMTLMNATAEEVASIHAALGAGFENGSLKPVIGREIPLADAPKAHIAVLEPGAYGKIVLVPQVGKETAKPNKNQSR